MADDRKKRGYERFARPASVVEEFVDEDKTPLPINAEEAFGWQRIDSRMVAVEAAVSGYTRQVDRHEQSITQWSESVQKCIVEVTGATTRLTGIETSISRDWERFSESLDRVSEALGNFSERMTKLEIAVADIGRTQIDQAAKLIALAHRVEKLEDAATAKQIASSAVTAERRRWFSLAHAAYVAITAAIALAGYLAGSHL